MGLSLPRSSWGGVVCLGLILGCGGDSTSSTTTPPPPPAAPAARFEVISGGDQRGTIGDPLTFPVDVRVTDAQGAPLSGRRIAWSGTNGAPDDDTTRTDTDGRTRVTFVLGELPGSADLLGKLVGSTETVAFQFTALPDTTQDEAVISYGEFFQLDLPTYEGSGETVHPDYAAPPTFGSTQAFLAITPYPGGNATFENPSIFTSTNTVRWRPPTGLKNPLFLPKSGYFSDPDMVYVPETRELWLYYRQVASERNQIFLTRSLNGVKWSAPVLVLDAPRDQVVSPAVVRRRAGDWLMWAVDAGTGGCGAQSTKVTLRRSTDGITWSAPTETRFTAGAPMAWHLDVQWIPSQNEYWALYNAKPAGSCGTPALMLARSADGVEWMVRTAPVLTHGVTPELSDIVYRSTFRYDPATDNLSMWVSGASWSASNYRWKTVFFKMPAAPLLSPQPGVLSQFRVMPSQPLLLEGP